MDIILHRPLARTIIDILAIIFLKSYIITHNIITQPNKSFIVAHNNITNQINHSLYEVFLLQTIHITIHATELLCEPTYAQPNRSATVCGFPDHACHDETRGSSRMMSVDHWAQHCHPDIASSGH